MIEGGTGASAPGRSGSVDRLPRNNVSRTIVAQFKQPSFLNYVYYTDYETLDPAALYNPANNPTEPTDCAAHYPNRGSDCSGRSTSSPATRSTGRCTARTRAICGSAAGPHVRAPARATTTRSRRAAVSTEGQCGCSHTYTINNAAQHDQHDVAVADAAGDQRAAALHRASRRYLYTGRTTIVLNGTTMTVHERRTSRADTGDRSPFPTQRRHLRLDRQLRLPGQLHAVHRERRLHGRHNCGNVYVSGNYSSSLTIASDNDIIINGSLTRRRTRSVPRRPAPARARRQRLRARLPPGRPTAPARPAAQCGSSADQRQPARCQPDFYAAILAVNHSFIVDNYDCGSVARHAHVVGAIAQLFRGPVGTSGGSRARPATSRTTPTTTAADERAAVLPQPGLGRLVGPAPDRVRHRVLGRTRAGAR